MSAMTTDLDDVEGLLDADRDGLLRAAAMAGAGVRAVSQAQSEGVLDALADLRPRALVIVTGSSTVARSAAELLIATVAARIDVPVVAGPALPGWIGPLDVVVVVGDDAGDPALADAAMRSLRRRAEVVIAAPIEGPLREAIAEQPIIDLAPRLSVDARFGFCRLTAALIAVCVGLTAVRMTPAPPDLAGLADLLDEEAAADHPAQESFHNQAKLLAMRAVDRSVAWAGDTPGAAVVAAHAGAALFGVGGAVSHAGSETTLVRRLSEHGASRQAGEDLFYDPEFDSPRGAAVRGIVLTTAARRWYVERRVSAFGDIDVVSEQPAESGSGPDVGGRAPVVDPGDAHSDGPADLAAYLVLALRAELAAVFVRLMGEAD